MRVVGVECETKNSRSLHETINERCGKTSWAHCGCKSDKHVNFLVQLGMNAKGGEGLGSPLTETNITEIRRAGYLENIFDRVGYIVPSKVIDREVPKLGRAGVMVDGLFGVLVASIVAEPDVIPQLCKDEGNRALWFSETNPYFGVHEKTVVKIDDWFSGGCARGRARLVLRARYTEYSQKIAIFRKDDVLFYVAIAEDGTKLFEITRLAYTIGEAFGFWS